MQAVSDPVSLVRSAVAGIAWPAIPDVQGASILALQFQLELSQWYRPGQLLALQTRQLDALLAHAYATVPYYRRRWADLYRPEETIAYIRSVLEGGPVHA